MSRRGKSRNYPYGELTGLDAKILELPYTDPNIAMYVILPNAVDGKENAIPHFMLSSFYHNLRVSRL